VSSSEPASLYTAFWQPGLAEDWPSFPQGQQPISMTARSGRRQEVTTLETKSPDGVLSEHLAKRKYKIARCLRERLNAQLFSSVDTSDGVLSVAALPSATAA
jgi:hypothetical protein